MAVALILAADTQENVVVQQRGSRTTHVRPSEDAAANCLCNHGWPLSGCFFLKKTLFFRGFAERARACAAASCFACRRLHATCDWPVETQQNSQSCTQIFVGR